MLNYKQITDIAYQYHINNELDKAEELYEKLLKLRPDDANILNLYAMLCLSKSNSKLAINLLNKALIFNNSALIVNNLAKAYYFDGDYEKSIILYNQALELAESEDTYYSLAIAYKQIGKFDKAIESYVKALNLNPNNYNVLYNLSMLYKDLNDTQNALKYGQKAEFINANDEDLHTLLAGLYETNKEYSKAIEHLNIALNFSKNYLYYYNLAVLYSKLDKINQAIDCYNFALKINPNHIESLVNIASLYNEIDKNISLKYLKKAFNNASNEELVCLSLAKCYRDLCNNEESLKILANLDSAEAYFLKAINYMDICEYELAYKNYQKAVDIEPNNPNYVNGQAVVLKYLGKPDMAKQILENIQEKSNQITTTLGMLYLQEKDFRKGMPLYIERSKSSKFKKIFKEKIWDKNTTLDGKTVLVYSDCGLGDTIMFLRYIPHLEKIAKKVILQTDKELISLIEHNFNNIQVVRKIEKNIEYDVVIPIMNLAYALNIDFDNIPFCEGYLKAPTNEIKSDKLKVGIFYQGNKNVFKNRSIKFEDLSELLKLENINFYSFQINNFENENENIISLRNQISDYYDTASLLKSMDLLITIDSSIVHIAGALGIKTYLLLPYTAEWRWFNDDKTTPWYKSVRIFKQAVQNDWQSVIKRLKEELI